MATLIGIQWKHGGQFLTNYKLLNVISTQLMDCNATIDHNALIPVINWAKIMFESLNLAEIVKFT